ncbi:MAG: hypothetical protein J2P55_13345 [Rhizobiales bacterium]|nr:hypothetical protein [Hyphomicrobiales bacterium]
MRQCGDCQLCCKLVPVPPLEKKAGQRCQYQKFGKGCTVHHTAKMPPECRLWNCRWLTNDDTADLARPDRSHYVIDPVPDYISLRQGDGEPWHVPALAVWCDPNYPDAHRDPALRAWMYRRALEGIATLIRYNARDGLAIFAPPFDVEGEWHERPSDGPIERTHSMADIARVFADHKMLLR